MRHAQYFVQLNGRWECADRNCKEFIRPNGNLTHKLVCKFGPGKLGHDVAREQIARHGRDRYPTTQKQLEKVAAELVELAMEIGGLAATDFIEQQTVLVKKEYADTGLALYELGNKLGLNLIQEMTELVSNDERKFT